MTTFLKFTNEAQAKSVMPYAFAQDELTPAGLTFDVVGEISKPTGVMLTGPEGEYPEYAKLPGYHVNVIGNVPDELVPFEVVPIKPMRVFAV